MSKRTRKAPERKAPLKKVKSVSIDLVEEKEDTTRTFESSGWLEGQPVLENWLGQRNLDITGGNTVHSTDYEIKTVRAGVKVFKGIHYYEVKLLESTNIRIGWALDNFKPREHDGLGCDVDSWGYDCSRQRIYHNTPGGGGNYHHSWNTGDGQVVTYGEYCNVGDVIGCLINFEDKTISYRKNRSDFGIAFKFPQVKANTAFHPTVSLSSHAKCQVCLGPSFSFEPSKYVFGLNTTCTSKQAGEMIDVFQKYQGVGLDLNDSQGFDLMRMKGVLSLASDMGVKDEMDPHILVLAWKMRSRKFCEFYEHEWNVLWSLCRSYNVQAMNAMVVSWITDIIDNEATFKSFYMFVFDYLLSEKGGRTALEKNDAINAWQMLHKMVKKKWPFFNDWIEYWKTNDAKGVNRDCWKMIIPFMDRQAGVKDAKKVNYDENDIWPISIEDFVEYLKSK